MKRNLLMLVACFSMLCAWADEPFRNHRYDSFKALEPAEGSILFIGNSITDMHCWPEVFKTSEGKYLPIVNRGNSGTYSTEQSNNIESYLANKPKKVFMMIGTNDLASSGGLDFTGEQILAYINSIVKRIQLRSPETKIYLYSILNNNTSNRQRERWLHANEVIKAYADATEDVTYIDLYDKLTNVANGGAWSYDNLHLTAGAYQAWAKEICQYLQEDESYTVSTVYPDNTLEKQNNGGLGGAHGMRATYFSMLPISNADILFFGDEMVKNGEWQELLGNLNVKNRGTGWGYGGDIATTSKIVDATYAETGVEKQEAKAIFLYTGTGDANGTTDIETVKTNYKTLVDKIKEKSPTSTIYLMSLCPTNNANNNTNRISALNTYMQSLAGVKVKYVDVYTSLLNGTVANTKYFYPSNYLGALGYVKVAQAMKSALNVDFPEDVFSVIDDATAETRYAQAGLRNSLGQVITRGLVAPRGDEAGQYNAEKMKAFDAKIAEANTILEKNNITQNEVTSFSNELNTILNSALSMPKASTSSETIWYQLSTPQRNKKYLTSTGAGAGVVGEDKNNYATSMWKFVARGDNSFDIVNRNDNSYLAPTAGYNTQITTSATQPTNGWTLSYANTPGLFIISSGTIQLNQTTFDNAPVYNWSNGQTGTDRGDSGCQYLIEVVVGEPDELPDPSLMTLTLTPTEFEKANGKSTWTYHGNTTSGGWYGKFVTGTTPAVTVESTNLAVNNMGWSQKRPWLQTGYTYNITVPKGYEITEYELSTLDGDGFNGTFTYTTADGVATSPAQTTTEQTVVAKGLSTDTITLKVGTGTNGTKGILITKLVIRYKEVPIEEENPSELTYIIDKANGNLYHANGGENQNWNNNWKSNITPQLQFGCGPNNMNWANNNVQLMTGSSGSATYSLTIPTGYVIAEYSFTFANNNHNQGLSLTMDDGKQYTTKQTSQTISSKQKTYSMSFTLAGANGNGVVLTDFVVKIKEDKIEAPEFSTEGNEHWYYIASASTQEYCKNQVIYYDSDQSILRFDNRTFSGDRIWSFWKKDGKVTIKNYNGQHFGTAGAGTGNSTAFGVVDAPNYIYTIQEAFGAFIIKDSNVELHAQSDGKKIVRWASANGNASLWKFDEVDISNAEAALGSTRVQQGKVTTAIGNKNQPIVRSVIQISGLNGSCTFQGIKGRFDGTDKNDITNVKAYFATNNRELFIDDEKKMTWRDENAVQFGETTKLDENGEFSFIGTKVLTPGNHYIWITYDIADNAQEGNLVDASITSYTIDDEEIVEESGNPEHMATIFLSESAVLMPMDKGSLYYRIPSITVSKDGKRLVTLTDDRKAHNSDLPSHCYLVAQYSEDNGKTWSNPVTVAGTAETGGNYGHGDASIVTNRDNGEIVGIMTSAGTYGHGFFAGTAAEPPRWKTITSKDGGLTWETPVDHTDDLFGAKCDNPKTQTWKSGFSGSGAALQKRDGTLVSSFVNREADNSQNFYFFMSKDGGKNWYVSGTSGTKAADEPKTLERNNGDLAISVRASGYNYYNYTSDDGETWHNPSQTRFTTGISGNACDGEYMVWCSTLEGNKWDIAFQTLPNNASRKNVSIALSTDEGATFGNPKTICPRGSAYSATVVLPDGTLGCYYEEEGVFGGFTMRFVRFSLDWASNGKYKFSDENPFFPIKSTNETDIDEIISNPENAENDAMYDLQGRRITTPQTSGIYIQNGKKVIVK
ncbi:MAG: exo-alpha-sialidase [Bacteroidaceae bacterium]|nr:exo-alpha-sialidase [Bacteroidaceae bacterium]